MLGNDRTITGADYTHLGKNYVDIVDDEVPRIPKFHPCNLVDGLSQQSWVKPYASVLLLPGQIFDLSLPFLRTS
jgi:hypothetical protein